MAWEHNLLIWETKRNKRKIKQLFLFSFVLRKKIDKKNLDKFFRECTTTTHAALTGEYTTITQKFQRELKTGFFPLIMKDCFDCTMVADLLFFFCSEMTQEPRVSLCILLDTQKVRMHPTELYKYAVRLELL